MVGKGIGRRSPEEAGRHWKRSGYWVAGLEPGVSQECEGAGMRGWEDRMFRKLTVLSSLVFPLLGLGRLQPSFEMRS